MSKCEIKDCESPALCRCGNAGGLLVCKEHLAIFSKDPQAPVDGPKVTGPESLIAGRFYHHAGLYGVLYFAAATYWTNPATGIREPQPGSEQLICLNGDIAGAVVTPPDDQEHLGSTFWEGFYPAPGLMIAEHLMDGMQNVIGQLVATEKLNVEDAIKGALNTAIGSLQRVQRDAAQLGHADYEERRPIEIFAKDTALAVYYRFINRLMTQVTALNHAAYEVMGRTLEGTQVHTFAEQMANDTNMIFHLSPFHPEHPKKG